MSLQGCSLRLAEIWPRLQLVHPRLILLHLGNELAGARGWKSADLQQPPHLCRRSHFKYLLNIPTEKAAHITSLQTQQRMCSGPGPA